MQPFYRAVLTYFGYEIYDTINRIDYWLSDYGHDLQPGQLALIFNLVCTALSLMFAFLFFKTLWNFTKSLIQWGVNKLWI